MVAIPMLANRGIAIFVSSVAPEGEGSKIMKMFRAKSDEGTPEFLIINWLTSCDRCRAAGTEDQCTHVSTPIQPYQSSLGQRTVANVMKAFDEEGYKQEMLNISSLPPYRPAFSRHSINRLFALDNKIDPLIDPVAMYIGVDPSFGVGLSEYAIITTVFAKSRKFRNRDEMIVSLFSCHSFLSHDRLWQLISLRVQVEKMFHR